MRVQCMWTLEIELRMLDLMILISKTKLWIYPTMHTFTIFCAWVSDRDPPNTVKSWLNKKTYTSKSDILQTWIWCSDIEWSRVLFDKKKSSIAIKHIFVVGMLTEKRDGDSVVDEWRKSQMDSTPYMQPKILKYE